MVDTFATVMPPIEVALINKRLEAAQLEALARIATALDRQTEELDAIKRTLWNISDRIEDLPRYMGGA